MKIILTWFHWNGLFGEEVFFCMQEAESAQQQYERDGCKVSIEVV